jgi:hypothetical protein
MITGELSKDGHDASVPEAPLQPKTENETPTITKILLRQKIKPSTSASDTPKRAELKSHHQHMGPHEHVIVLELILQKIIWVHNTIYTGLEMQQHAPTKNERERKQFWHIQTQSETGDGYPT